MNVDNETYLEIEEYDAFPPTYRLHGWGWSDSVLALAMKMNFFPTRNTGALEEILGYMREHDIPALDPKSLVLSTRLIAARVRIINPEDVQP